MLLHGLARTGNSMHSLQNYLSEQGYHALNIDYPSRKIDIAECAKLIRAQVVFEIPANEKVHFITHSMGGIIVRYIQKNDPLPNLGRVVMLSPPNQGSEIVDRIGDFSFFKWINGPSGNQLGTDSGSVPKNLGKVSFELGVITGDRSINWINSILIPGNDDGKVSVENAKVEGMSDFLVIHVSHPFIMKNKIVMNQCVYFIRNGKFRKD